MSNISSREENEQEKGHNMGRNREVQEGNILEKSSSESPVWKQMNRSKEEANVEDERKNMVNYQNEQKHSRFPKGS